jgi:hypothetical protein
MLQRRDTDGFNLAFLDVMACGLGAVILIFMLIKFNAQTPEPVEEAQRLKAELAQLLSEQEQTQSSLASTNAQKKAQAQTLAKLKNQIESLQQQSADSEKAVSEQQTVVAELEKSVAAAAPKQAEDQVKLSGKGEETYLLGLKVEGRNIGILLDSSASMTDEKLMDIISTKVSTSKQKKAAAKWQRTKRVARWLLARVPSTSKVSMVSFNDKASLLGSRKIVGGSDKSNLNKIANAVDRLIPSKGTNLQSGLKKIKSVNPTIDSLYVITDGLPTVGEKGSGLSSLASNRPSAVSVDCICFGTVSNKPD